MTRLASTRKSRVVLWAALAGALLLSSWWMLRGEANESAESRRAPYGSQDRASPSAEPEQREPDAKPAAQASAPSRERGATFDRAKRDALRSEILQALAERPHSRPVSSAPAEDEPAPEPGQLTDRIGGREALLEHLNHDFMPLADECIEQARARRPELEGMLAIGIDTVADEELGGIVEAVTIQPQNEVDDTELLECLSQTALSMILPPPPESGREQFMITMPIEPPSE